MNSKGYVLKAAANRETPGFQYRPANGSCALPCAFRNRSPYHEPDDLINGPSIRIDLAHLVAIAQNRHSVADFKDFAQPMADNGDRTATLAQSADDTKKSFGFA